MNSVLRSRYETLQCRLREFQGVLVAYSGGVDSTLLLQVARDTLGAGQVVAVTARSSTYSQQELEAARRLASGMGLRHLVIESEELDIPGFSANTPQRCYYCKRELFNKLLALAAEEGIEWVADGSNADDAGDYRPGMRAAAEMGIVSPLKEAGLSKGEVRELSRHLGLPTWDKPAMACLSSRFPYGQPITREKLARVEEAETYLRSLGIRQLRVRYHDDSARIEVESVDFPLILAAGREVAARLKNLGFTYITLDLEGYRSGSMNEVLLREASEA